MTDNASSQDSWIEVTDLKVWFPMRKSFWGKTDGFIKAVDSVSFKVIKGETLGLVGESGSGKSTIGKTLVRLVDPTSGSIRFEGKEIGQASEKEFFPLRKKIQMIFQDPYNSLNPRMTVASIIGEPLTIHFPEMSRKQREEKVSSLLERVGLNPDLRKRYPHQFSGGQRQRIGIARALSVEPSFIICDEAVSALDVSVQAQIINLLQDLQEELGLTYLFIAHDLAVVEHISDRVLVMSQGKIVEQATAEEIYTNPKDPYTKKLLSAVPKMPSLAGL